MGPKKARAMKRKPTAEDEEHEPGDIQEVEGEKRGKSDKYIGAHVRIQGDGN